MRQTTTIQDYEITFEELESTFDLPEIISIWVDKERKLLSVRTELKE